jgi:hypothetical protein
MVIYSPRRFLRNHTLASGSRIILTAVYDGLVKTNGTFVTMEAPMLPRFITNAMAGV